MTGLPNRSLLMDRLEQLAERSDRDGGRVGVLYLDLEGIAVSTGSACASGSLDPSHVLLATGMPVEYAHGSVRFSLGRGTTEAEILEVLEIVPPIIARIRSMSTAYEKRS